MLQRCCILSTLIQRPKPNKMQSVFTAPFIANNLKNSVHKNVITLVNRKLVLKLIDKISISTVIHLLRTMPSFFTRKNKL